MASTTDTQMALANDPKFIRRIAALLTQYAAGTVLTELTTVPNHPLRRQLAQQVITNSLGVAAQFSVTIAMSTNIFGANTSYDFVQLAIVTDATDAAISSQIATLWNGLAGV
jgi:hypothetical protein